MSDEDNAFAVDYYNEGNRYLSNYTNTFPNVISLYHVEDNWITYDILAPVIAKRRLGASRERTRVAARIPNEFLV